MGRALQRALRRDRVLTSLDPEVGLQTPGGPRLRGHDQARDWFEKEFENVRSRIIPHRFVEEGDVVAGLGRIEVRWIESGEIAREFESAAVFWFRHRKIVRWQPFDTYDAALKAAGLAALYQAPPLHASSGTETLLFGELEVVP